jgi:hypothetical protein
MRALVRHRTWAAAFALMLLPGAATAEDAVKPYAPCDRTPNEGEVAAAKGAFQAGDASFNEADYDRAINYWEDAYRRDCTAHLILRNLARAYELNNQKRHAVGALETFVARNPGSSEEAQIKRRIEKLHEQIESEAAPRPAAPAAPPPAAAAPAAPPPPPAPEPTTGGKRSITPLIVAGAGGAVAIVGGILFITGSSDVSTFESQCPNRVCPSNQPNLSSDANAARTKENIGGVLMGVGLAAGIGGVIWYFVQRPARTASAPHAFTASVSPVVSAGYGGLGLAGQF